MVDAERLRSACRVSIPVHGATATGLGRDRELRGAHGRASTRLALVEGRTAGYRGDHLAVAEAGGTRLVLETPDSADRRR